MNILVAGGGKLGLAIIEKLAADGCNVTLIDGDPAVIKNASELYDVMTYKGSCVLPSDLIAAGIESANVFIAATDTDEKNLLSCAVAYQNNAKIISIARVRNPEYVTNYTAFMKAFHIALILNPERDTAMEVERMLSYPAFMKRETFVNGRVEILELRIAADSKLCGITLAMLPKTLKCKVLVCAAIRGERVFIPKGDFIIQNGDRLFVTALRENLRTMLNSLGMVNKPLRSAFIVGATRTSFYLCKSLIASDPRRKVQVLDGDAAALEDFNTKIPEAVVTLGDMSNLSTLQSEKIEDFDAVVALTGFDEMNMMIGLYASSLENDRVVVKVGRASGVSFAESQALGSVVCPIQVCSANVLRYVRAIKTNEKSAAKTDHAIAEGRVTAMEFEVTGDVYGCNLKLCDMRLRDNVLITGVRRGTNTKIADGETMFSLGDTVVVVSGEEVNVLNLNDIYQPEFLEGLKRNGK